MENKIQELTDKIYREGVEKGNEEAQRLVSEAQAQAEKLIEDAKKQAESILAEAKKSADELNENTKSEFAKKQAESILAEAKKSADELNENTKSELKLFAGQAVNALKTEVANLLTNQTVEETVKGFTADKEFLYKFILALAEKWSASGYFFATTRSLDEPITTEWSEKLWLLSRQFSA